MSISEINAHKTLEISGSSPGVASVNLLPPFIQHSILAYISPKDKAAVPLVQQAWKNPFRGHLDLRNTLVDDRDLARILKDHKDAGCPIVSIDLSGCKNITNEGLKLLAYLPLIALKLGSGRITDGGLEYLNNLPLRHLELVECEQITDDGLIKLLPHLPLENLKLWYCDQLTNKSLEFLAAHPLKELQLGWSPNVADEELELFSQLPLTQLDLSECDSITDKGLAFLGHLPLRELSIWWCNHITNEGLGVLSNLPLTKLSLRNCHQVTDEGFASLNRLPLTTLHLWACPNLTDKGVKHFESLPLEELTLNLCSNVQDAERLSKELPIFNRFRQTDCLKMGQDASQSHNYSDLYKLILELI